MGLADAPLVRRIIDADTDGKPVGHYGYFRRVNSNYWSLASRFIGAAGAPAARRLLEN